MSMCAKLPVSDPVAAFPTSAYAVVGTFDEVEDRPMHATQLDPYVAAHLRAADLTFDHVGGPLAYFRLATTI